ncbi:MAG TPA: HAD family hydrolase, partial [Planctomycetota bacterium]|nr:HAD family hydrolase [Planctomycetota bacterium]
RFTAGERAHIFDHVLEELGLEARIVGKLVSVYRTHVPKIRLCPDARRFLERPPAGVAIGVITDGRVRTQREKTRALGLDRLGDAIVITGRWGPRYAKPHPRAFRRMEKRFRLAGAACVYVADNPAKDFQAPQSLGWNVWRLRRPGGLYTAAPSPGVPAVRSCDELRARIT